MKPTKLEYPKNSSFNLDDEPFKDLLAKGADRMSNTFDLMVVEQMEKDIKALEQAEEQKKNGFSDEVKENIKKSWGNSIELPK